MFPTAARLSKASRAPLTPKRGNKDFYKGTRQAFLPGGRRTGAPGRHVIRGSAKYQLIDEKVRVYVAPAVEDIEESELKPYVSLAAKLTDDHKAAIFGKFHGTGGLTPQRFLRISREHTHARLNPKRPFENPLNVPGWMHAQIKLNMMDEPKIARMPLKEFQASILAKRRKVIENAASSVRQLEVVNEPRKDSSARKDKNLRELEAIEAPSASSQP